MGLVTLGLTALIDSMTWQYKTYKKIRPQEYIIAVVILSFAIITIWVIWTQINI